MEHGRQAYQRDLRTHEGVTIDSARIIVPHVINTLAALVNEMDWTRIVNVSEKKLDNVCFYALDELEEIGLVEIIERPTEGEWPLRPLIVKIN